MKKYTCHLDHHQRSRHVTIGQRNWVRKLIDNQKVTLLENQKEKLLDKKNSSNQPNQFQIQFVIDQGNLVNTQLQYKTTLKYIMRSKRSTLTMRQFVKELRQTWTSKFQDYHILLHAQSASVRDLIQKIENHPNRHALQRDLRQSQSSNPFSPESKQMIHEVGNIELCELLETEPKTQRKCLSFWDIGIVYCTCWHFLRKGREENQKFIKYTMDLLSIPDYVIKKGRPHGHRYGKKPGDKEYYIANQLKKKCTTMERSC